MPHDLDSVFHCLTQPNKLWSRAEVLRKPCPVPDEPGIYAWYFEQIPPDVPVGMCHTLHGRTMLYVGISPSGRNGGENKSEQSLLTRIRTHFSGNADSSTLRLSLGCLLAEQLSISLRPKGRGGRLTFGAGEDVLSAWMAENAFVAWCPVEKPWEVEEQMIQRLDLPLNLQGNRDHSFYPILRAIRKKCKHAARVKGK